MKDSEPSDDLKNLLLDLRFMDPVEVRAWDEDLSYLVVEEVIPPLLVTEEPDYDELVAQSEWCELL